MRCDAFFRAWNKDRARTFSDRNVRVVIVHVPDDASIDEILAAARAAGASKDAQYGVFQVQTDRGIFTTVDARPIVTTTPYHRARLRYQTWKELEDEETNGAAP